MMKPTLLFTALSMVFATPAAHAKSELETLRALCQEQERQIRQLEDENTKLRSDSGGPRKRQAPVLSAATQMETITNPAPAVAATYTVKAGDSLEKIARKAGTSPEKLAKSNGLKTSSIIQPGQKLKLPGISAAATATATAVEAPKTNDKTHTVRPGETYSSISKKYSISAEALAAANPTIKPTALRPGQIIHLSASAPSAPPIAQAKAPAPLTNSPVARLNLPPFSSTPTPSPAQATAVPAPGPAATPPPGPTPALKPITTKQPAAEESLAAAPLDKKLHPVAVDAEMTYGEFAAKHGTSTERLNALNGLDLTEATVLAKGSELYVPAQP